MHLLVSQTTVRTPLGTLASRVDAGANAGKRLRQK
jgi:hypothetical protein